MKTPTQHEAVDPYVIHAADAELIASSYRVTWWRDPISGTRADTLNDLLDALSVDVDEVELVSGKNISINVTLLLAMAYWEKGLDCPPLDEDAVRAAQRAVDYAASTTDQYVDGDVYRVDVRDVVASRKNGK